MKTKELLEKSRRLGSKELLAKVNEEQKRLFTLQQEKILGKLKNTGEITSTRKAVARLRTILDEKITEEMSKP